MKGFGDLGDPHAKPSDGLVRRIVSGPVVWNQRLALGETLTFGRCRGCSGTGAVPEWTRRHKRLKSIGGDVEVRQS